MFVLNLPHTIANMFSFAKTISGVAPNPRALRAAYLRALMDAQGSRLSLAEAPVVSAGELRVVSEDAAILAQYGARSPVPEDEQAHFRHEIAGALRRLGELDESLRGLVELMVADFVLLKGERSGACSVGWQLGVVHLAADPAWGSIRWQDTLLHESIHLHVFLADFVYGLFVHRSEFAHPASLVPSAVREGAEKRPFDGSFHSACVAIGLMYLNHLRGDEARVREILDQTRPCLEAMRERGEYLTPYGAEVLGQMRAFVAEPHFDSLKASVKDKRFAKFPAKAG